MVRRAKAKINRVNKKHNINVQSDFDLPFNLKPIDEYQYRDDLNSDLEGMRRFTDRRVREFQYETNKYGVTANRRELLNIQADNKEARRIAKREQDKILDRPYHLRGEEISTVGERSQIMGKPEATGISVPSEFNFDSAQTRQRIDQQAQTNRYRTEPEYYERKQRIMQENYIKTLEESLNSDVETDETINKLKSLTPEQFFYLYDENEEFDFRYFYMSQGYLTSTGSANDLSNQLNGLIDNFKDRYKEEMNFIP